MAIGIHHVKSKLAVAYLLIHTPEVSGHIPDTELLRESAFHRMIRKYDKIYLRTKKGKGMMTWAENGMVQSGRYIGCIPNIPISANFCLQHRY
jgi:hypothetical protein